MKIAPSLLWVVATLPVFGFCQGTVSDPFDAGVTYKRTLHVSPGGTPTGDGSPDAPFDSIRTAARHATAGTRILVQAGTYIATTRLSGLQGEAGKPIAIVASGDVVLDAAGASTVISGSDLQDVVIEGFTLSSASAHGISIDAGSSYDTPANFVILRGLTIPGSGSGGNNDCIKLSVVDHFFVLNRDVAGCNRGEIIDMVGCHEGLIAGNYFHDTVASGLQTNSGSADMLIHGNVFADIPVRAVNSGGSTASKFFRPLDTAFEAARIRVLSNVFVRNGATIAYAGCDGCVFAQNTVIEPRTSVARILQESTERKVRSLAQRPLHEQPHRAEGRGPAFVGVEAGTATHTLVFGSNLWYALDRGADWTGPTYSSGIPPEAESVIQRGPALVDRLGRDYHILRGSPAEGAGRVPAFETAPDYEGLALGRSTLGRRVGDGDSPV